MRVLIDIDDSDAAVIAGTQDNDGNVTVITPTRFCHARVVGMAEPLSVAGRGDRYRAMYDITLLDALTA